jgi:hypothetical protein
MGRLLKFWYLTRREKRFFWEASILLSLSSLCVRTIPFRHIDSFLRARWKGGAQGNCNRTEDIKLIALSLARAANPLPWKSLCLSRSIAAFVMLRRRGIPAAMITGVKSVDDSSLFAHAWVQTAHGMIGGNSENAAFTPLVRIGPDPVDL